MFRRTQERSLSRESDFQPWWLCAVAVVLLLPFTSWGAQDNESSIPDITGKYHFLTADDTLAILEEEGKLKGYLDVYQGEEESDEILSFNIVQGTRKKNHVEFRTNKIHRKYYRFSGTVERGPGHKERDPDYLRLIGDLDIVTLKGDSGQEAVQTMHMIFKSYGKNEEPE